MATGKVKMWNPDKGFGFIRPDGDEPDLFFHVSVVQNALDDEIIRGTEVEYDAGMDKSGRAKATRVAIADGT